MQLYHALWVGNKLPFFANTEDKAFKNHMFVYFFFLFEAATLSTHVWLASDDIALLNHETE